MTGPPDPWAIFDAMLGHGTWPEPPTRVALRLLDLDELPGPDGVKSAFRRRVMEVHPDLAGALTNLSDGQIREATSQDDLEVQEVIWARDVLLRKVPPVTTGTSQPQSSTASCHGPRRAQARIDELIPLIEKRRAERAERGLHLGMSSVEWEAECEIRRVANHDCRWCGTCGRDLAPDEQVWRLWGSSHVSTRCEDCVPQWERSAAHLCSTRCAHCDRPVRLWSWRARSYCCEVCRNKDQAELRRRSRAEARAGRDCESCGKLLDADRSDARYCSNACRQRAYRRRVAEPA